MFRIFICLWNQSISLASLDIFQASSWNQLINVKLQKSSQLIICKSEGILLKMKMYLIHLLQNHEWDSSLSTQNVHREISEIFRREENNKKKKYNNN